MHYRVTIHDGSFRDIDADFYYVDDDEFVTFTKGDDSKVIISYNKNTIRTIEPCETS